MLPFQTSGQGLAHHVYKRRNRIKPEKKDVFDLFAGFEFESGAKFWRWDLTGHQYLPRSTCGQVKIVGCAEHGEGAITRINCDRLGCPKCYEAAAADRAMTAVLRFGRTIYQDVEQITKEIQKSLKHETKTVQRKGITTFFEKSLKRKRKIEKHFVISPEQETVQKQWLSRKGYIQSRKQAYKLAAQAGIKEGMMIPHPYRLKCADCGHHPIPDHQENCPNCNSGRFIWYWSPHFHVIGTGWVSNTSQIYKKTGWIIKNLGVRKSVFATIQYLLSHAGVSKGTHTITWFGKMGTRQLGKNPIPPKLNTCCKHCGKTYQTLTWTRTDRPPPEHTKAKSGTEITFTIGDYA